MESAKDINDEEAYVEDEPVPSHDGPTVEDAPFIQGKEENKDEKLKKSHWKYFPLPMIPLIYFCCHHLLTIPATVSYSQKG